MLNWFDTSKVDELAGWIVTEVQKRYPVSGVAKSRSKATERFIKVHDSIFNRVDTFARTHRLNIFKKARLGNRVRWGLLESGYPAAFAESLSQELVTVVALIKPVKNKNMP
jgi:hypothetical protein